MKKIWKKPKLIVLARSMPEENVLRGCKVKGWPGNDPRHDVSLQACSADPPAVCQTYAKS